MEPHMPTPKPGFRILDHTADIAIEANAPDLPALFSNAARGMFAIIASLDSIKPTNPLPIKATADNLDDLLLNWLSELLYLSATKAMLFSRFHITQLDANHIWATALGEPIDHARHELYTEIKAVTYHDLKVEKIGPLWTAHVLFDV